MSQTATTVSANVLKELHAATITDHEDVVHLELPRMAPATYAKLKTILADIGFVWNRHLETHVGSHEDLEELERIRNTGRFKNSKQALEFFATAPGAAATLANIIAEDIAWKKSPTVLEPSAGEGSLIEATLARLPHARVIGVECDPRRARILRSRFAGDTRVSIVEYDFLSFAEDGWDAVLMNPPFDHALAHVRHAYELVRPFGHIVGIASIERTRDRELANWLNDRDAWLDPTDPDTFVNTAFQASFFGLTKQTSWIERMRTALAPHHSITEVQIRRLTELSRDLHRLAEAWCNGVYDDEDAFDAERDRLLRAAREILAPESIGTIIASDPRAGHGLRLQLPSGVTNDFAQSGIIVPDALPAKYAVPANTCAPAAAIGQLSLLDLAA